MHDLLEEVVQLKQNGKAQVQAANARAKAQEAVSVLGKCA
jgi:hypothetical protein